MTRIVTRLTPVLIAVSLVYCSSQIDPLEKLLKPARVLNKDSLALEYRGSKKIQAKNQDLAFTFLRPVLLQDSLIFCLIKERPNSFAKFNLQSGELLSIQRISSALASREKIANLHVHNQDSIFVVTTNSPSIVLLNGRGEEIGVWDVSGNPELPRELFISPYFLPMYSSFYDSKNDVYFFTKLPAYLMSSNKFNTTPLHHGYKLKTKTYTVSFGSLQGVMKCKGERTYPYDLSYPYLLTLEDYAYVNYPMDHYVYKYDLKTGQLTDSILVCSKSIESFPKPIENSDFADQQTVWNFRISAPFYEPLLCHSSNQLFTRVVHHPQNLKSPDGTLNNGEKRTSEVLILDKNLKIVGNHLFENGELMIHSMVPMSNGLLLLPKSRDSNYYHLPTEFYGFKSK